jgi:hypothetical protein
MRRSLTSGRNALINLLIAAVIIFIVFNIIRANNDDREPPQYEIPDTSNQLRLSDPISASHYIEVNGDPYILVMSKQDNERIETADLRIISVDSEDDLDQAGWLHTSMSIQRPVEALAYANGHVYVGKTREGTTRPALWVVDLSDPGRPYEANLLNAGFPIRSLAASDDGYMVASGFGGDFLVYDIRQGNEPEVIGTFSEELQRAPHISLSGSTLVIDHMAGVIFYDMSDLENPEKIGEIEHPEWREPTFIPQPDAFLLGDEGFSTNLPAGAYLDVDVADDLIALASGEAGIELYGFRSDDSLAELAVMDVDGRVASVTIDGDRLYALAGRLADGDRVNFTIHTVDISNPEAPQLMESTPIIAGLPRYQNVIARDGDVWIMVNSTIYRHQTSSR